MRRPLLHLQYDPGVTAEDIFRAHLQFGAQFPDVPRPPLQASSRIRIGYVSGDFRGHAIACFLLPLLETHDRVKFEIFLYSKTRQPDHITEWFKLQGKWRDLSGDNASDARQIQADNIDILIDCAGHTTGKSLGLFALRPAPISATYLGYPDTTGLRQIDYRLTDEIADPKGALAVEQLVRLPNGIHTYRCILDVEEPVIRDGPIVFGYLGRMQKINHEVMLLWQRILQRVPGATLMLNEKRDLTPQGYFAAYNKIDIALDPFPYNGTTTICDALWMGVPVVALRGTRSAARVGASLLTRIGLQDLIASDREEYIDIALRLAADRPRLSLLRNTLRQRFLDSPLGDPIIVTRDLERFYTEAVAAARAGTAV